MAPRATPLFRADHVGSLLQPPALLEARARAAEGTIPGEALREVEDAAVVAVVRIWEDLGLQSATDGEFRRTSRHMDFIYRLRGVSRTSESTEIHFRNERGGLDFTSAALRVERSGGFEPLRFVPPGKLVVLGLVTTKRPALESKDDLKRRIDEAARYVPLEQLCLSPQCGYSSTVEGNELTEDEERAKLALIVETAAEVWG